MAMTNPPGGPYPPEGYGPPPLARQHPMGNPGHQFPPTVQQAPQPQPASVPGPRSEPDFAPPRSKGFLGSLFDMKFDYMVTPTVIKVFSAVTLLLITGQCLVLLGL